MALYKRWHGLDGSIKSWIDDDDDDDDETPPWDDDDWDTCRSDSFRTEDKPPDFHANSTHMCGISYPSSTPFQNMTDCCTKPPVVYHDCFHYCQTNLSTNFGSCVHEHYDFSPLMSVCNFAFDGGDGDNIIQPARPVPWQPIHIFMVALGGVMLLVLMGMALWRRRERGIAI